METSYAPTRILGVCIAARLGKGRGPGFLGVLGRSCTVRECFFLSPFDLRFKISFVLRVQIIRFVYVRLPGSMGLGLYS